MENKVTFIKSAFLYELKKHTWIFIKKITSEVTNISYNTISYVILIKRYN